MEMCMFVLLMFVLLVIVIQLRQIIDQIKKLQKPTAARETGKEKEAALLEGWWRIEGGQEPFKDRWIVIVPGREGRYQFFVPGEREFKSRGYLELRKVGREHWAGEMISGDWDAQADQVAEKARSPIDLRLLAGGEKLQFSYEGGYFLAKAAVSGGRGEPH